MILLRTVVGFCAYALAGNALIVFTHNPYIVYPVSALVAFITIALLGE